MSHTQDHILIVDDDRDIRTLLADYLEKQGLRCTVAADGREMKSALEHHRVDLIVLDVMMPGEDGLTLCRNLRAGGGNHANTPILMLTARGEDMDRILGLEMGADDYLPKPFVPRELYARIRAILRRARALPPNLDAAPPANARELHFAHWRLDTVNRHLVDAQGTVVALSGAEYRMLGVFLAHPQRVLSRDQLMELTQGREADVFDRSIDLLISRLRQRLGDNAREPAIIKTVRNEGYVLACEVTAQRQTVADAP
ncbi:response regulator [Azoarcus communis]|uniref:DNA-binding response regulator n=1 Tax=Parazoarcus communis SWub3 = DSM 12120 TaxID=1121029 RepID=A0A323UZZ8_9RHOO|nr:response regulator [Parazoarcus communis]NMG47990.1 response regulator [Parazoarcus communis]NMG69815.1 response regulator [Parazoarcus communis SWub3 = DSM 12120]PZA18105.1 DNA-binding response regulator [Azoarcus communis] [Parazoarcus communis SWub3 = DSM 12120]